MRKFLASERKFFGQQLTVAAEKSSLTSSYQEEIFSQDENFYVLKSNVSCIKFQISSILFKLLISAGICNLHKTLHYTMPHLAMNCGRFYCPTYHQSFKSSGFWGLRPQTPAKHPY